MLALLLFTGCKPRPAGSANAPGRSIPGVTADCEPWATRVRGPYTYENNVWGEDKAGGRYEQCLLEKGEQGRTLLGWTWSWPGFEPSVYAYPEIIFGWKPWSGGKPTDPRFPLKVGDVQQLSLHYHVETRAEGSYNLAPEVWLTRSGSWSRDPNPKLLTTEIMFWMDYSGRAQPAGRVIGRPTIDGIRYELWRAKDFGGDSGARWTYYAFKSPQVRRRGTISVHEALQYMTSKGLVSSDEHVASIEFGNEILSGSGTTWVEQFEVEVRP